MTVTELLETVRCVELRTNRLVNDTMVGVYSSHCQRRGMDCEKRSPLNQSITRFSRLRRGYLN